ncbi:MAG: PA14 domain-containing protein, partial [Anaerolineae bacterium]
MRLNPFAKQLLSLVLTMLVLVGCVTPGVGPTPTPAPATATSVPAPATATPVPPTPVVIVVTATPQPTPVVIVVTATPQPTATPAPTPVCTVAADALNLRKGPDTVFPRVREPLSLRNRLEPLARRPDGQWIKVRVQESGEIGWVAAGFISCNIDPSSLPLTEVPPTPTVPPTRTPTHTPVVGAWRGEYYANRHLDGDPVLVRSDLGLDHNWGSGAPDPDLPSDNFSVRWTRTLALDEGRYRFRALVDDGVRMYVDGNLVINEWRDGPPREVTGERTLSAGDHSLRVEYYERAGDARIRLWWETVPLPTPSPFYPDWKGEYWSNRQLSGNPTRARNDPTIDFHWGEGEPEPGLPVDRFSVRWSRELDFEAGRYRFSARADDGLRFYLDGELILDEWHDSSGQDVYSAERTLTAGKHLLVVDYYDNEGVALVQFRWERVTVPPTFTPTPTPKP